MEENTVVPEVATEQNVIFVKLVFRKEKNLSKLLNPKFKRLKDAFYKVFLFHY